MKDKLSTTYTRSTVGQATFAAPTPPCIETLRVAGRRSPLSRRQLEEFSYGLAAVAPEVTTDYTWVDTRGDLDKVQSLRTLGKDDFFTDTLDALLLQGLCDVAVHSAKDLPERLQPGLVVAATSASISPWDVLATRPGENLDTLPAGATVATSSERREAAVCSLRPDLTFCDLRGTIGERLAKLFSRQVDAIVVAEAALLRLGIRENITLERLAGETTPGQGSLSCVCLETAEKLRQLLAPLEGRLFAAYAPLLLR